MFGRILRMPRIMNRTATAPDTLEIYRLENG